MNKINRHNHCIERTVNNSKAKIKKVHTSNKNTETNIIRSFSETYDMLKNWVNNSEIQRNSIVAQVFIESHLVKGFC